MTQLASTESIANALVAAHAHRAPQHVVDLSIVAIRQGASRDERARLSDLMRLIEDALAVRRTPSS
ncbi:hypothetical protein [Sphingomonas sp. UYEF23]|uniref:hypothetical protein n=1 Tax=Sphingomonas sp. UYEF23 TaxID=1756408 RepID=UPI003391FBA5